MTLYECSFLGFRLVLVVVVVDVVVFVVVAVVNARQLDGICEICRVSRRTVVCRFA